MCPIVESFATVQVSKEETEEGMKKENGRYNVQVLWIENGNATECSHQARCCCRREVRLDELERMCANGDMKTRQTSTRVE